MAKAKVQMPMPAGRGPRGHNAPASSSAGSSLQERRNLEEVSLQLQESLVMLLLPKLCKPCQRSLKAHLSDASSIDGSNDGTTDSHHLHNNKNNKQTGGLATRRGRPPTVNRQSSASLDVLAGSSQRRLPIESICPKCKAAILGKAANHNLPSPKTTSTIPTNNASTKRHHHHKEHQNSDKTPGAANFLADMVRSVFARFVGTNPLATSSPSQHGVSSGFASPNSHSPQLNLYARCLQEDRRWCRFCGTTRSARWLAGPWGPKTLCQRHGSRPKSGDEPMINLDGFAHEKHDRTHPVVKDYCGKCWTRLDVRSSCLRCFGCPFAYHVGCIPGTARTFQGRWFCSERCITNLDCLDVAVELPTEALMPFCDVEVVSDTGEPVVVRKRPPPPMVLSSDDDGDGEEEGKENKRKRLHNHVSAVKAEPQPAVEIPIPGVIRHAIPAYRRHSAPSSTPAKGPMLHGHKEEVCEDDVYLERHRRYESAEVHSRICRPQILKKLLDKSPSPPQASLSSSSSSFPPSTILVQKRPRGRPRKHSA